ncbi:BrxA family protein [Mesorhizobium sp. M1342]|uniref:BrxA family protein n=1 Tax=Mesorhizobium sp. M1342 TaxID=2957088 RepID=UPI0033396893
MLSTGPATYAFIADFASEVLQERYARFQEDLGYDHFDSFFDSKAEWHPEFAELRPSTRAKLRQVLFRILREADLLSPSGTIMRTLLSPALQDSIIAHDPKELRFFAGASGCRHEAARTGVDGIGANTRFNDFILHKACSPHLKYNFLANVAGRVDHLVPAATGHASKC